MGERMPPSVSVVITAYDIPRRFLQEAIESALQQTCPPREVIVVDDGSTLDLSWVSSAYGGRVRYVRQPNGGPASARNLGIRLAQGDCVAFLDGDDVWALDKLERQVAALAREPEAALVYSQEEKIDPDGRRVRRGSDRAPKPAGRIFLQLFQQSFVGTSSVVARKACVERVGGFDESRELVSVEDYDLWLRLAERYPVAYVDRVLLRYRVHERGISRDIARSYAGERRVLERAAQRARAAYPQVVALLPRRLGQLHFACGHEYFSVNRLGEARAQFAESLRHQPPRLRSWLYYAATFLTPSVIEQVRRLKTGAASFFNNGASSRVPGPRAVLHVLNTLDTGGAEQVVLNLARHIDRDAFRMQVCGLAGEGPLAEEFRRLGVRVHALRRRPGVDPGLCLRLARLMRRERIDIVHTHNAGPWLYGGLAAKLVGARLVHTEHSNLFPHQRRLRRAERWLARWTDALIADSEKVKRQLVEGQGVPAAKVRVVVNGVDTHRFNGGPSAPEARQTLHVNGTGVVIGTVGRLVPVKDHRTLLEAFRRVVEARPASYLVLVGDGPMRGELVGLAGLLGIGERVRFLGERLDIPALLQAFDVFALSSLSEGMPLTVLEAMAAGKPVVATNVGGIPEAVIEHQTGLLVPPRDPERMAQALLRLLDDEALRGAFGHRGQARARERFDLRQMVETYESAYHHQPVS